MPINSFLYPSGALPSAYTIDNSLRFDDGSNDNLQKNFGVTLNAKKFTLSFWLKRSTLGTTQRIIEGALTSNPTYSDGFLEITSGDQIRLFSELANTARVNSTYTPLLRDVSAWYHIVLSCDTDQATATDRNILYINNNRYNGSANPSLGAVIPIISWTSSWDTKIGQSYGGANDFDGYLAEFYYIDGQQLDATSFGETDEDTGIWKPIKYTGTYGTYDFYLDFENSGSLGADVSGNGNDFTVNNLTSVDQSTDTPTNNFNTTNPLFNFTSASTGTTYSEGNLVNTHSTSYSYSLGTFAVSQGKWYWEIKPTSVTNSAASNGVGVIKANTNPTSYPFGVAANDAKVYSTNGQKHSNAGSVSFGDSYTSNDIIGVALDMDNGKLFFSKNGTWQNSGDPAAGTGFAYDDLDTSDFYTPFTADNQTAFTAIFNHNYGSPPYSITSGNSDANGYGNFEYTVPNSYFCLNSKNLAEYG